ncbi:DUF2182 domain-containing protein [Amphritea balenae]|uniref:DUF2182 domain-containing protein n=1 Tax=Amphritea balenae TaxID=452629 RepID=A0A3P1SPW7_9GAMM|nr:DUF2182 domain-containing protein [Amphritea balenae]RRC99301.1 DUF2182 domain-containing protein [Amphritea balenae]GGK72198.1 metal-binding protein [Amphritea balenae]
MMTQTITAVIRRDRIIIGLAIGIISLLAWIYMVQMAIDSTEMMSMAPGMKSSPEMLWLNIMMWSVMMVAMMLPSASPMILCFTRVTEQQNKSDGVTLKTLVFITGYLSVWCVFSVMASLLQFALSGSGILSLPMVKFESQVGAFLLVSVGLFQWSTLKQACLTKCRSPLSFLLLEWRRGYRGAFIMGVRHGVICTGCCWALMLLMFVGGVMNLIWMAALTVYVLVEKVIPDGRLFSRISGLLLVLTGVGVLITST